MRADLFAELDDLARPPDGASPSLAPHDPSGFFAAYGLLGNPFPPNRTIDPQVLHNQETVVSKFVGLLREFTNAITAGSVIRLSMGVIGGTASGKSHFVARATRELAKPRGVGIAGQQRLGLGFDVVALAYQVAAFGENQPEHRNGR